MVSCKVISGDAHVVEPPDLWTERMDPKHGDRIPHLVRGESFDKWYCGNQSMGVMAALGANSGMRFERAQEMVRDGRFADVRPGGYDPHAHIKDIESDGVYASIVYPSIALNLASIRDQELTRSIFAAYNDWVAEFCKPYPNRLKGRPLILLDDDVEAGIAELQRTAEMGLSGALITTTPAPHQTYDDPMYEPFWAAAEEMDVSLSLHSGTTRPDPTEPDASFISYVAGDRDTKSAAVRINLDHWVRMSLAHLVLSGVFERHPELKFISVENDVGWVPFLKNRCDSTYSESTFAAFRFKGDTLPSDFLSHNIYYGFMDDPLAIPLRNMIGVDQLVWGSDYPHAESTFPRSQEILNRLLEGVSEDERIKIVGGNAANVYGFELD